MPGSATDPKVRHEAVTEQSEAERRGDFAPERLAWGEAMMTVMTVFQKM
jgi:hypothetical protein